MCLYTSCMSLIIHPLLYNCASFYKQIRSTETLHSLLKRAIEAVTTETRTRTTNIVFVFVFLPKIYIALTCGKSKPHILGKG